MPVLKLQLDQVFISFIIANNEYTLAGKSQEMTIGGGGSGSNNTSSGTKRGRVKLELKHTQNTVMEITPKMMLDSIQEVFGTVIEGLPQNSNLADKWSEFADNLASVPILSEAKDIVEDSKIRISDLTIDLNFVKPQAGDATFDGTLSVGIVVIPDASSPLEFFNTRLTAVGGIFSISLKGNADIFGWVPQ